MNKHQVNNYHCRALIICARRYRKSHRDISIETGISKAAIGYYACREDSLCRRTPTRRNAEILIDYFHTIMPEHLIRVCTKNDEFEHTKPPWSLRFKNIKQR